MLLELNDDFVLGRTQPTHIKLNTCTWASLKQTIECLDVVKDLTGPDLRTIKPNLVKADLRILKSSKKDEAMTFTTSRLMTEINSILTDQTFTAKAKIHAFATELIQSNSVSIVFYSTDRFSG